MNESIRVSVLNGLRLGLQKLLDARVSRREAWRLLGLTVLRRLTVVINLLLRRSPDRESFRYIDPEERKFLRLSSLLDRVVCKSSDLGGTEFRLRSFGNVAALISAGGSSGRCVISFIRQLDRGRLTPFEALAGGIAVFLSVT